MTGTDTEMTTPSVSPRPKSDETPGSAKALSEFQNLGNGILFFDPPQNHNHDDHHAQLQPQLIIFCTWLGGATRRRIAKYTSGYRRLFPTSPILVIRTVIADFTVRSEQVIRKNLVPARDVVRDVLSRSTVQDGAGPGSENGLETDTGTTSTATGTGVLLHMFSNGGCHLAVQLAHGYLSYYHQPLPVSLQILDSSPGTFSISQTYGAAVHSIPSHHPWALQTLEKWGLWGAVVFIAGFQRGLPTSVGEKVVRKKWLGGVGVDFEEMRGEILNERVWGGETGRLYLYSKADEAVSWRDVERHVEQAKRLVKERAVKKGIIGRGEVQAEVEGLVRAERFEKATHCGLVMEDEERYWAAVRESWEGQMERRRRMRRESHSNSGQEVSQEKCKDGKVVLGAMDEEQGEGQTNGIEPGKTSGVEDGVESRGDACFKRSRTSKL
ncbi:hypothetical protein QBC32DRAFT_252706 [Pseudoneurospora amorphoporcata]|uniref:Indole-diterpene biosynthesis protein PaxU n=1 Tax=Pseudoneurospora amorphoporcata TaxID=241081 RepID=A0AAN6P4S7_9PEZI|nr:hypothetical protein QBC32DRAFT_252706 [Pseudoneurospora amorphoporcata]